MILDLEPSLILLLVIAFASFLQTIIGFSFGVIVVSAATLINIAPIEYSAAFVSFTSLFNIIIALKGNWSEIDPISVAWVVCGLIPGVICGVVLLNFLSIYYVGLLKLVLGFMVLVSAVMGLAKHRPFRREPAAWASITAGYLSGLGGGLFSSSSPPLVYYLNKLNLPFRRIKNTLLVVFFVSTMTRIVFISLRGDVTLDLLTNVLLALPVIGVVTLASGTLSRFDPQHLRQLSFMLLVFVGVSLIWSSFQGT